MNLIKQDALFCDWLLLFDIMFVKLIYIFACSFSAFFFLTVE